MKHLPKIEDICKNCKIHFLLFEDEVIDAY